MRVVVTGASGNVGSTLVERLGDQEQVTSIVGICRRRHGWRPPRTEWQFLDVADDDLAPVFSGADAVVHLAWLFQPSRHPAETWRNNVHGTQRVLDAVAAAEVPHVVVASSVGCYSPRRDSTPVTEDWPTAGSAEAGYSREKSSVERLLDLHEAEHPERRVARMRPVFIFQRRSASQQHRLFAGPWVPRVAFRSGLLPVLPLPENLRLQALHTDDVADAYVATVLGGVSGAINLASESLGPADLARLVGARWVPAPARALRLAMAAAFRAHVVPAEPGLLDLALGVPLLDAGRARSELGWQPRTTAAEAIMEFLDGASSGAGWPTPPLAPNRMWPATPISRPLIWRR
jgi:nucleoside-diphosphate-sugar epimerase